MSIQIHKSEERGEMKLDWLDSKFSFSFADYHNPKRHGFGLLRVLNDDVIAPKSGFDMHHHRDMEIITIILKGTIDHKDSIGSDYSITEGEVQVMSAGSGIFHSEMNSHDVETHMLQIWIQTDERGHKPRYDQMKYEVKPNELQQLVSSDGSNETLMVHQDVKLYRTTLDPDKELNYETQESRGTFIFVIEGELDVNGINTQSRDSIESTDSVTIKAKKKTEFILVDVPMS